MNTSQLIRTSLYLSLAFITYLLLLAWGEDYPPGDNGSGGPTATNSRSVDGGGDDIGDVNPQTQQDGLPDIPSAQPAPSGGGDDLPAVPQPTPAAVTGQPVENLGDLVEVTTDTLSLQISLSGGDIVYLALPQYKTTLGGTDPFVLLDSSLMGRRFVAQSGLIGANGIDTNGRAIYQAADDRYTLAPGQTSLNVDLVHIAAAGVRVTKRYTFHQGSYLVDIRFIVENPSADPWQANPFGQLRRDRFDDPTEAGGFLRTFLGFVTTTSDDPYIERDFGDIDDRSLSNNGVEGGWVGFNQQYFLTALVPPAADTNRYTIRRNRSGEYLGEFTTAALGAPAGGSADYTLRLYAGPKDKYALQEISPDLDLTVDYSWLWFIASPIHWLLLKINGWVVNWGLSIILLTFIVKAVFYKLSETQYRSMAGMRRLMPKMQQLRESYGDDKMQLQKATMDLYKKEKINPFGGCLPMLVQMPVFIALYWVLLESVELRHAPFMLWINDLSARDPFFILPILMGGTMFLQTAISPAPADPMQAKVMKLMPVMMTALFLFFPSGLVLYWLVNSLLGILQQWYITRKVEAAYEAKRSG